VTAGSPRRVGRRLLRALLWLLLALVVLYLLFFHIFPWVEARFNDPSLETAARAVAASGLARA
jgi:hypothetical protein